MIASVLGGALPPTALATALTGRAADGCFVPSRAAVAGTWRGPAE